MSFKEKLRLLNPESYLKISLSCVVVCCAIACNFILKIFIRRSISKGIVALPPPPKKLLKC